MYYKPHEKTTFNNGNLFIQTTIQQMQKGDKIINYFANIFGKVATINNGGGRTVT